MEKFNNSGTKPTKTIYQLKHDLKFYEQDPKTFAKDIARVTILIKEKESQNEPSRPKETSAGT